MKLKVAVDCDDVLLGCMQLFVTIFNDIHRKFDEDGNQITVDKKLEDVTNWEFYKDWNVPESEIWFIFDKVNEAMFYIKPIDALAYKFMKKIKKKCKTDIVTARLKETRDSLVAKLYKHRIIEGITYDNLIIVNRRHKLAKLKLDYNIYIDDSPNLVDEMMNYDDKILLLYDRPWNRNVKLNRKTIRVKNWREVWKVISAIIKRNGM